MREQELAEALQACKADAKFGYDFATACYHKIQQTLEQAQMDLVRAERKQSQVNRIASSRVIAREQESLAELQRMNLRNRVDLQELYTHQKEFSIVVFGRTMAGKSTLMEILTHGNGASIGKGAQRTTKDVREYHWRSMKITDVPGIGAFDGEDDEKLALRAAKAADLILFLITDDGPKDEEAAKLAKLKKLGKNVLGIINVKVVLNLSNPTRRKMAVRSLKKKLAETARIHDICEQFRAFGPKHGQDWSKLAFVATHLYAASLKEPAIRQTYLGQACSEAVDPELYEELYKLSNFEAVEKYILDKVQRDARFLRVKTFLDRVSVPLSEHVAKLLDDAAQTLREALVYRRQWHEMDEWSEMFLRETQEKCDRFKKRLMNQMDAAIDDFAERNYENQQAGVAWNKVVTNLQLEQDCQNFLEERAAACNRKRRALADELATEIRFASGVHAGADGIRMEEITDYKRWVEAAAAGANAIAPFMPVGWGIRIGLSVFSLFFDSKEKKIREAKASLRNQLRNAMRPVMDDLARQMLQNLNGEILQKGILGFRKSLVDRDEMFFELAAAQIQLAETLNAELDLASKELWKRAADSVAPQAAHIFQTCRIPGYAFVAFSSEKLLRHPLRRMEEMLGETIHWIKFAPQKEHDLSEQAEAFAIRLVGDGWDLELLDYGAEADAKIFYIHLLEEAEGEDDMRYRLLQQLYCAPMLDDSQLMEERRTDDGNI